MLWRVLRWQLGYLRWRDREDYQPCSIWADHERLVTSCCLHLIAPVTWNITWAFTIARQEHCFEQSRWWYGNQASGRFVFHKLIRATNWRCRSDWTFPRQVRRSSSVAGQGNVVYCFPGGLGVVCWKPSALVWLWFVRKQFPTAFWHAQMAGMLKLQTMSAWNLLSALRLIIRIWVAYFERVM